ncbi:MAG: hypothetical protein ACKVIY_11265 [Acidimicrobiales bacterium]
MPTQPVSHLPQPQIDVSAPARPNTNLQRGDLADVLTVEPWHDPVIDTHGHDPRSPYVERFWIAVLGPSAVWLLRRVARELDEHPDGLELFLPDLAGQLGLGWNRGRNSPMYRTIERCCSFKTARHLGPDAVAFRRHLAPLTQGQVSRLPISLAHDHAQWASTHRARPAAGQDDLHAPALAIALIERGSSLHAAVDELAAFGVPLEAARKATAWAWARHRQHPSAGPPSPPTSLR